MSLVSFGQSAGRLLGVSIYDADPDWELSGPTQSGDLTHTVVNVAENDPGSWLIFNHSRSLWGTLLRAGDTPYNDCLPPSEALFLDVFQDSDDVGELISTLDGRSEDQFLNPFYAVIGDLSEDSLFWFHGSFQSNHGQFDDSSHVLLDGAPSKSGANLPDQLNINESTELKDLKESLSGGLPNEPLEKHLARDGMRETQCATLFHWTSDRLVLEHSTEFPPGSDWRTESVKSPAA
ncbi:MAG: hypothetical protein ABEK50_01750 [bacterium]